MSNRLKKILLVIAFILIVFLIALALYFAFFRPTPPPVVIETTPEFPGALPSTPTGQPPTPIEEVPPGALGPTPGIIVPPEEIIPSGPTISTFAQGGPVIPDKLVEADANFVNLSSNGSSLNYYDSATGLFNRVNRDGSIELLSNKVFRDVKNVTWAPTADKAVLEFPDGSNIVYDFNTEQSFTLPKQYEDFSFSPDSDQIAAKDLKLNKEDRWLVIVDDSGKNKTLVEHLGDNADRVKVKWNPNDVIIATSAKSIDQNRAEVIFLTKNGQRLNKAIIQGRDFRYDYSPSGNKMAYSVYNANSNYLPTLWVTSSNPNAIDLGRINTGLNTWADKCAFADDSTLYCAVPTNIGQFSGILPDNNDSDDVIYKINTNTGQSQLIAEPLFSTQIGTISVSKDTNTLFYTDATTGAINRIDL